MMSVGQQELLAAAAAAVFQENLPREGCGEYCTLDSCVDVGAVYMSFACLHRMLPVSFTFSLLIFSFENRPAPFSRQR